jgi:hypothetical protein
MKETKKWTLKDLNKREAFEFFPEFIVNPEDEKVECRYINLKVDGKDYKFNYLDLYMFIYFCGNEALRQELAAREERKVEYIPYQVEFLLKPDEIANPKEMIKRKIELPVSQLEMYIATQTALRSPIAKIYNKLIDKKKFKTL